MKTAKRDQRAFGASVMRVCPRPGDRVAGRFVLERTAGSGSAGIVYRALDLDTGQRVALKLFHPSRHAQPDRSHAEARALAAVDHPAVVRYVAHGATDDGTPFLAMSWVGGETLAMRLAKTGLTPLESVRLARRLSDGLEALHARGIVHRDLKPSNIVLPGTGVEDACIVDLGVARDLNAPAELGATEGEYVGTPRYMAPEQIRAPKSAAPYSDVFALGCILYECLCGAPAFSETEVFAILAQILFEPAPKLRSKRPELPAELEALLAGLLARNPAQRPSAGEPLNQQLTAAMSGRVGRALSRLGRPVQIERGSGIDVTAPSGVFDRLGPLPAQ